MSRVKPSRTAQGVAAERAWLTEMGVLDDPFARDLLGPAMSVLYRIVRRWPNRVPTLDVTLAGLATRVRWHDRQVLDALDEGIDQVVIVGAGYDSRAWRLARDGVSYFELDQPATQEVKMRAVPSVASASPTFVAADLRIDDAAPVLVAAGLDPDRRSVFVIEGVTMYLSEDVLSRQLQSLAAVSPTGSRLSTDFYPPKGPADASLTARQARIQRLARAGSGERLGLLLRREDAVALLESCGWRVTEALGAPEAARKLLPDPAGLPIAAIDQNKSLVAASVV